MIFADLCGSRHRAAPLVVDRATSMCAKCVPVSTTDVGGNLKVLGGPVAGFHHELHALIGKHTTFNHVRVDHLFRRPDLEALCFCPYAVSTDMKIFLAADVVSYTRYLLS